jgi:Ca2+:H+ antiporter
MIGRGDRLVVAAAVLATVAAGVVHGLRPSSLFAFAVAGVALAALAALVGRSVDGLGAQLGAGATGVVQAALGNLPELFVSIFALRAGLVTVVQAALVGSVLGNLLLVLGLVFLVGSARHGPQSFDPARARTVGVQLLLAVGVLLVPTLAHSLDTPAAHHEHTLSTVAAVALLTLFVLSLPGAVRRTSADGPPEGAWPVPLAVGLLAVSGAGAAFASDWFVAALTPAVHRLGVSQAFAGLVIVALAGNAVENAVGIVLAARNRADYAVSIVLNSPLQIVLVVAPLLVLTSPVFGGAHFTLVLPPLLFAVLAVSVLVATYIVSDGSSSWLEGAALLSLYAVVAASFWWG